MYTFSVINKPVITILIMTLSTHSNLLHYQFKNKSLHSEHSTPASRVSALKISETVWLVHWHSMLSYIVIFKCRHILSLPISFCFLTFTEFYIHIVTFFFIHNIIVMGLSQMNSLSFFNLMHVHVYICEHCWYTV